MSRPVLSLIAVVVLGSGCGPAAGGLAITGVTVIDVATGERRADQTVVVAGDSIVAVGPAETVRPLRGSRRIDGRGQFLIPGLWDMHVHLSMTGAGVLPVLLSYGVTGVRDMGGDPVVVRWRDSVEAGSLVGPRIKTAAMIIESKRWLDLVTGMLAPLGRPELMADLARRFPIETPEDAHRAIDSLVQLGADFVKIRNFPSAEAYFTLVREARRRGLQVVGHPPPLSFLAIVSDSGFQSIEHGVLDVRDEKLVDGFAAMTADARRQLFGRFAHNQTAWDPTFVSGRARLVSDSALARMIADTTGTTDPALGWLPTRLREEWRSQLAMRSVDPDTGTDWAGIHQASLRSAREMVDAGMVLLAGTDLAIPSLVPGRSLHDELVALVTEAALTPLEALRTATSNAAAAAGLGPGAGTIAPGRLADLVLLEADPLVDITAIRRVAAVVAHGRFHDRNDLDRLRLTGR